MKIAFFGSSLVSSYWNGAATYYRGLIKALAERGHSITFYEPDALDRQRHRDIDDPAWARVVVYPATPEGWQRAVESAAREADMIAKCSGVGVFDSELEIAIAEAPGRALRVYWDVDAPATLDAIDADPNHHMRRVIPRFDAVLTYGGGDPVVQAFARYKARLCVPIYNALDPETHHPVAPDPAFACDLGFLGNRMPDREQRVYEFFIDPAKALSEQRFILGGSGWEPHQVSANVRLLGHVPTADHNAFFCSSGMTLNVNRASMARYGFSPPTRVFEAAGAGTCIITDAWTGIEHFFAPGEEILVAHSGDDVIGHVRNVSPERRRAIAAAAMRRALAEHTYRQRARQLDELLGNSFRSEAA